jgi:hypothetical protein
VVAARALAALAIAASLGVAGCASGDPSTVRARTASATPWIVPPEEHQTQRLLRARLESDEGRGRFRLLLRLRDPTRYQIRATHPLFNRRLWSLDVDGDQAVLVDHHQHTVCRYQDEAEIGAIPLGPFPFESLPALLLGYLPLPPAGAPQEGAAPGALVFDDALGRRWSAVVEDGAVLRWEVESDDAGTVEWKRTTPTAGDGEQGSPWSVLTADDDGLDLRWQETLRERLTEPIAAIEVPGDYTEGECDLGWLRAVEDAPIDE